MPVFTSESARNASLKFWQAPDPITLEERNRKLRKLAYGDPEVMQQIQQLYKQGMNTCDIAKQFNVHKNTILRSMHQSKMILNAPPVRYEPNLTPNYHLGYTLGVIYGDGFCYKEKGKDAHFVIGLNTIDKEFLEYFSTQLCKVLGRTHPLKIKLVQTNPEERQPYYKGFSSSNKLGEYFKHLTHQTLEHLLELPQFRIGFLRGFFDSEGCICLHKENSKRHPKQLTINAYNTDLRLLELVKKALALEEVSSYRIYNAPMPNRWNVKPLYQLLIHDSHNNLLNFVSKIGSRIKRKQENIQAWKTIWNDFNEPTSGQCTSNIKLSRCTLRAPSWRPTNSYSVSSRRT